jgi:Predicted transcriptional regulators
MPARKVRPHPFPGFGARIKQARVENGFTLVSLASALGTSQSLISLWEKDACFPSDRHRENIKRVLGMDVPVVHRNPKGRVSSGETTCPTCGKGFIGYYRQRYCSRECSFKPLRSKLLNKRCRSCHQIFQTDRDCQKYCSNGCAGVGIRTDYPHTHCEHCGEALPWPRLKKKRFCSRKCSAQHHHGGWSKEPSPIGSRREVSEGYVKVRTAVGWELEHRYVMEQKLGRALEKHERVHHKNGNRADNRPENLELWKRKTGGHAIGVRADDYHCPGCRCQTIAVTGIRAFVPH